MLKGASNLNVLLRNVRLEKGYIYEDATVIATETEMVDVEIVDGKFSAIGSKLQSDAETIIDAKGQLLVPSYKEMHIHIDKTYFSGPWIAPMPAVNGIFTRFEEESQLLPKQLSVAEERAHAVVQHYIQQGHTHIRTHVNIDPHIKTQHMDIVKRVLAAYDEQITYEIVAFPQHGLFRNGEGFIKIFEEALQKGVTHIGGVDPALVDGDIGKVLHYIFDLAEKYNVGVDIHIHERDTLGAFEMNRVLDEIERRHFTNDITISHAFALANLPDAIFTPLVERMAKHQLQVTTTIPIGPQAITIPVKRLHDLGVRVAIGHDSLTDHWSPFGTGDTTQKLNQFVQRFGYIDEFSIGQSLRFATGNISPLNEQGKQVWPKVGDKANALLVDAVSSAHYIARRCPISTVISKGQVIYEQEITVKGAFR